MAHVGYRSPISYTALKYPRSSSYSSSSYHMPGASSTYSTYSTKKPGFNQETSSGYGRNSPSTRTHSYSSDRLGSSGSSRSLGGTRKVSNMVHTYQDKYPDKCSTLDKYSTSSNITTRPPSGRKLPSAPGPHDEYGRKIEISDAIRRSQKNSDTHTGPIKATYTPSSYNTASTSSSSRYDYGTSTVTREVNNLHLGATDSRSSIGSLERSGKYGSTNSTNSIESVIEESIQPLHPDNNTKRSRLSENTSLPDINTLSLIAASVDKEEKYTMLAEDNKLAMQTVNEEVARLSKDIERVKDEKACKICMEEEVNIAFVTCGHLVCCSTCAISVKTCPICRETITGRMRVYHS